VPPLSPPGPSPSGHALGPAEQAGISVAVIVVVLFLILVAWFRWRREKKRRERRERAMRNTQDKQQGGWYEKWMAGKTMKETEEGWTAPNLPSKPDPVASTAPAAAGIRQVSKSGSNEHQHPYVDGKPEMPAGADGRNRHEIDSFATSAARNKAELDGTGAPQGGPTIAELPAEPVGSGQTSSSQLRAGSTATAFEYNPSPSYALQPPASPRADAADQVSPISDDGVGTYNSLTPIARKPVGGTANTIPEKEQAQQQYKSHISKMLGGGSARGKLDPSGGANV
jgi:cbb3-type cytochrome oxidase subunit 3